MVFADSINRAGHRKVPSPLSFNARTTRRSIHPLLPHDFPQPTAKTAARRVAARAWKSPWLVTFLEACGGRLAIDATMAAGTKSGFGGQNGMCRSQRESAKAAEKPAAKRRETAAEQGEGLMRDVVCLTGGGGTDSACTAFMGLLTTAQVQRT